MLGSVMCVDYGDTDNDELDSINRSKFQSAARKDQTAGVSDQGNRFAGDAF